MLQIGDPGSVTAEFNAQPAAAAGELARRATRVGSAVATPIPKEDDLIDARS
jgi:hypothetical protein